MLADITISLPQMDECPAWLVWCLVVPVYLIAAGITARWLAGCQRRKYISRGLTNAAVNAEMDTEYPWALAACIWPVIWLLYLGYRIGERSARWVILLVPYWMF